MSVFECINGHEMSYNDKKCNVCGESVYRMDGMTSEQWDQWEELANKEWSQLTEGVIDED